MGLIFTLLGVVTLIAFLLAMLWLVGGMVRADGGDNDGSFAVVAQLGWLRAEIRPRDVISLFAVTFDVTRTMFSIDRWGEVFDTIKRNKLRTALTSLSVAWGIFVMVVLLGMGHGLNNGVRYSFRREAHSGVYISASKTSVPYDGYGVGRRLTFNNRDYVAALKVDGIEHLTGQFFAHGGRFGGGEMKTQRGVKSNAFQVNPVHAAAYYIDQHEIVQGRFLNDSDVATLRKAAVIGRPVRDYLFGHGDNASIGDGGVDDPLGQWITVGGVPFEVVGVFANDGGEERERQIYIPVSTAQLAFSGQDRLGMLAFTIGDVDASKAKSITKQITDQLAASHQFSPNDKQAARVFDTYEGASKFNQFFLVISIFVVVIGCGTLAAGVVGVSNIMMIAVKERTREIGIRKALGATPQSIVAMIVQEAVFLTAIAGLLGLCAGVLVLSGIPPAIESNLVAIAIYALPLVLLAIVGPIFGFVRLRVTGWIIGVYFLFAAVVGLGYVRQLIQTELIRDPSVDIGVGVAATVGLIVAGALAGFVPARAAARVNPVATLRDA
jgi:putative ABC transport system permease protein